MVQSLSRSRENFSRHVPLQIKIMVYVYLLISEKDGNFYTGSTRDLKRRLNEHNDGQVLTFAITIDLL